MAEYLLNGRNISRGQVYYIEYEETVGSEQSSGRPAVVVSCDQNNNVSQTVEVVYMTTRQKTPLPTHVKTMATGRESTILCEQIFTVDLCRVGNLRGRCSPEDMRQVDKALLISLGLTFYPQKLEELSAELSVSLKELEAAQTERDNATASLAELTTHHKDELFNMQIERDKYKSMYDLAVQKLAESKFATEGPAQLLPTAQPPQDETSGASPAELSQEKLDINSASEAELVSHLGIPHHTAVWIIDFREKNGPFCSVDDLARVRRVGKITLEKIAPYITLGTSGGE